MFCNSVKYRNSTAIELQLQNLQCSTIPQIAIIPQLPICSTILTDEAKLIEEPLKSKKVKTDYQLGYNIHCVDTKINNIKTKNWITTFHDQIGKPIIGRVLNDSNEDKIRIEHWIQDLENDQISPLVQLPILKKCGGCEVKTNQIRNKRSNTKVRCITDINIENCVKINANSIQNDRYIADMAIYEALAQAECKYYRKQIANSLMQETDIEIYTDRLMKNVATSEIMMGCAFVISAPIKKSFNCGIVNNPFSNKAELMAVILSLMICPKAANVEIYSDSQWVVNTFDDLNFLMIKDIERSKITKVKAYGDCDYNKEADKLAKSKEETSEYFWKCSKIQNVVQDIIKRLKIFLVKIIQEYSKDDIDTQKLKSKINGLSMWEIGSSYDFIFLMKNQVSCQLIEFLRCFKITEKKLLYKVLKQITGRVLLEFKVLIWKPRNELQIKEEKQYGISDKDKKAKSHSKRTEVDVKDVDCNMLESNWNKWNDLAFHRGVIESLWIGQFVNLLHDSITSEISDISRNILDDSDENNVKGDEINDSGNNKRAGEGNYDYNIDDILSMDNGDNNDTSLLFNALYM
ncbi:hypothetical protein GLOIN_2v1786842 [Rhizophagus irregularis DAOM 181602=DAOM 197198]|uniref:RNase H type-1 domain-containing protein n=1 Tax=Rhizophagus irregularis (strain DAOM 181602 / DAOM 197198 / MUCL 43194) TaxID=747089 RepID=A0A2P4P7C1_RHIID|nr:hypothetical protein GLOIN_2v1786842 [Rhizophagus irregularis DAOM 181602=DAOM 197198]POG61281.1 hypothetical protein GLOIN_2v1786842 [Rhizophagus irregularis DAOM 181602=DAOM 197198]|eukprot:XP_025168147.1 hypothetical protein GLOIN_2v1786842 [Rhizophagus irregularis DAOM 181602=DAOM 197198]